MTNLTAWSDIFDHMEATWAQGEHVCLVGPTGSGKTTIARELLPLRRFVCALAVKREDSSLRDFGWPIKRKIDDHTFDKPQRKRDERFILWPKIESIDDFQGQHDVFKRALRAAFAHGRWTLYADDLGYLSNILQLDKEIRGIAAQGRSAKLTFVTSIQRPSRVPVEVYSEVGHLFIFRPGDGRDGKRLMEIAGAGPINVREMFARSRVLPEHGFLYVDVHKGVMLESILPLTMPEHAMA